MSNDRFDLQVQTTGNFFIRLPILAPPDPVLSLIKDSSLNYYKLIQALVQSYWNRWHIEYLSTFRPVSSGQSLCRHLQVGDIVVVGEHNYVCLADGDVQCVWVSVRTASGLHLCPLVKLFKLPL